jgi:hypothetical protein
MKRVFCGFVFLCVVQGYAYQSYNEAVKDLNLLQLLPQSQDLYVQISRDINNRMLRYDTEIRSNFSEESFLGGTNKRLLKDLLLIVNKYEKQIKKALGT